MAADLLRPLFALSWPQRMLVWLLWASFLGPLLVWAQRRRAPGLPRLLSAAPVIAVNLAIPRLFDGQGAEVLTCFTVAVATAFLSNLKIVAWVLDRGALLHPHMNVAQFCAVVSLPIIPSAAPAEESSKASTPSGSPAVGAVAGSPAGTGEGVGAGEAAAAAADDDSQAKARAEERRKGRLHEAEPVSKLLLRFLRKCLGLAAITWVLSSQHLPYVPLVIAQTYSMYMVLSIASDFLGAVVATVLRMPVSPHFDSPYGAISVADFWNKRWNQIVSQCLRACCYDPIMEGRLVHQPCVFARFSARRRLLAVLASFALSGLLHEGLYWYPTGRFTPHLRWFWHFTVWGLLSVAENIGKKLLRRAAAKKGRPADQPVVPTMVAWPLFQILLHVMVAWGWLPPLNAAEIISRGAANIVDTWAMIGRALLPAACSAKQA